MNNNVLIILGMHRSGTSLVAQWLHRCGLHIGDQLAGAGRGNVEGHFEDLDFLHLHEGILGSNGLPLTGYVTAHFLEVTEKQKANMQSLLEQKNSLHEEWGWKEPRTCLFVNEYRALLPDAKYLVLTRNFNEVVDSLIRRDFKNHENKVLKKSNIISRFTWKHYNRKRQLLLQYKEKSAQYLKVWIAYNEQLLQLVQSTNPANVVLVNIEHLYSCYQEVYQQLTQQWHFRLLFVDYKKVYKQNLFQSKADITSFIKEKATLHKAKELTAALQQFILLPKL